MRTYDIIRSHVCNGAVVGGKADTASVAIESGEAHMGLNRAREKCGGGEKLENLHFCGLKIVCRCE